MVRSNLPAEQNTPQDGSGVESLKIIIEEQRRDYDYLLHIYNRTRATESILLTATFGVVAYLYYSAPVGSKTTIATRLFFPTEDYGKVIYVIAAGFFAYGILKLMLTVFGNNPWETAYDGNDPQNGTEQSTLEYIKKRYNECHAFNSQTYIKRKDNLEFLFFSIIISAIILIVIKTLR
jgi:hypothetical protein